MPTTRISARVSAISESATLAVDAKAKALKAAGRPVIGFGAGEPDFPTPGYIVEAAQRAAADPKMHQYTPAAGLPELRSGDRGQDRPRLRLPGDGRPGARHQRRQAGRLPDVRDAARPRRRGAAARARTGPPTRRRSRSPAASPWSVLTDESSGYLATVEQLEAARTERTKLLVFVSPSNPTGAVYPPEQVKAIGEWAAAKGIWVVTDEIYEHLVYGDAKFSSIPVEAPRDRRPLRRAERRGEDLRDDRLAGRLDDRPEGRHQGRGQPAVARHLERRQRLPGRRAGRGVRGPVRRGRDAGGVRPAAQDDRPDAQRDPRRDLPRAAGRVLRLPERQGRARQGDPRASGRRPPPSWRRSSSRRPRSRSCPARRSARDGYFRLSYALGDADLEEGVRPDRQAARPKPR